MEVSYYIKYHLFSPWLHRFYVMAAVISEREVKSVLSDSLEMSHFIIRLLYDAASGSFVM
jgi:hypothetical protein